MINGVSVVTRYLIMKIAGIDASTTCSGVAIVDNGKLIYHDAIDMKKNKNTDDRVRHMMKELGNFINKQKPDMVYIEDSWNKQNIETTKMLSNILGAVMYVCEDKDIQFVKLLPSAWRSAVGIPLIKNGKKLKREELKQEAVDKVVKLHKIKCGDDEAEAICIAEAGWYMQDTDLFD